MFKSLLKYNLYSLLKSPCSRNYQNIGDVFLSTKIGFINPTWMRTEERLISSSTTYFKARRSYEEKAAQSEAERKGRRVIKYMPKGTNQKVVELWRNMTVQELADTIEKDLDHLYECLSFADPMNSNLYGKNTIIHNPEVLKQVVKLSGFKFKMIQRPDEMTDEQLQNKDAVPAPPAPPEALRPRPAVVTVMGHVDHGKTTLLDALRDTSVVDQEFGGITQHIGAFSVKLKNGDTVTFLDTPGHAAFSAMRSRGAHHTDIVVLVVAADDGVMEQTVESIRMARDSGVPVLVAVNKIDKPKIDIDRTFRSLSQHGILVEALGGDVQAVSVSALKRMNLDVLVEAITLQAQLMDLQADPSGYVEGVVVESQLDPKRGKQATVIVQRGTLRKGCVLVAGQGWGKVRVLMSSDGTPLQEAPPSTPVQVLGWKELPNAGDQILEVNSEKRANEVIRWRMSRKMEEKQLSDSEVISAKETEARLQYKASLEKKRSLGRYKIKREGPREKLYKESNHPRLNVVVKGDVDGSVEAILDVLETYDDNDTLKLDLVHYGVGHVTQNDLELAEAFKAIVYTFNTECSPQMAVEAKKKNISIKRHNIIYKLIDDLKEEINKRIPITKTEEIVGEANILQQFRINEGKKKATVAGCRCVKGELLKNALYRIVRADEVIFEGKLTSMKHLKNEVDSIKRDVECGLRFNEDDLEVAPGDTIICYRLVDASVETKWDPGF